jgi:hypothetical protein
MSKALFIHNAAFHNMMFLFGIKNPAFNELQKILLNDVGRSRRLLQRPFITVKSTDREACKSTLSSLGYDVYQFYGSGGKDKQALIKQIKLLDASQVDELVLVGWDEEFLPILRRKASEGVDVYVVATRSKRFGGPSSIGVALDEAITKSEFRFIDLAPYVDRLRLSV